MLLFLLRLSRDFVIRQTAGRLKITFVCLRLICSLEHLFLVHYTVFKEHPVPELTSPHRAAFPRLARAAHFRSHPSALTSVSLACLSRPTALLLYLPRKLLSTPFSIFLSVPFYAALPSVLFIPLPECCNSLSTFITPFCPLFIHYIKKYISNFRFFCIFGTVGSRRNSSFSVDASISAAAFGVDAHPFNLSAVSCLFIESISADELPQY